MPNYPIKIEPFRCNGAASLSTDAVQMRLIRSSFKEIAKDYTIQKVFNNFFETTPNYPIKIEPNWYNEAESKAKVKSFYKFSSAHWYSAVWYSAIRK